MTNQQIDSIIKESIRECLNLNPSFDKSDTLVLTTYQIMLSIFIDKKKYVLLEAPTGSGKSVIAYLTHFCFVYITNKLNEDELNIFNSKELIHKSNNSYLLTSSKMLQEQLSNDIPRFNLDEYMVMLKGVKNYECKKLTEETKIYHDFSERHCLGMGTEARMDLDCYNDCAYLQIRNEAAIKDLTILSYSYFLNVLKNPMNPYFGIRDLTICDEAHLIPDIVLGMYNIVLTQFTLNKILKLSNQIQMNFKNSLENEIFDLHKLLNEAFQIFQNPNPTFNDFKIYYSLFDDITGDLAKINSKFTNDKVFQEMFKKDFAKIKEENKYTDSTTYLTNLELRPNDVFIKSELVTIFENKSIYKHTLYDLSEAQLCRDYFLSKLNIGILMSATLGNVEEFANLIGLKQGEYAGFRLGSNFDFSTSPINLVKSGHLDYNNFSKNIDKVLFDTIKVVEELHSKDKGIIHTSTFKISNLLREKINSGFSTNRKRYLFYDSPEEKEACVELMKEKSDIPYVIVGPSLYEGLDLKDEQGRFNIIVKIPYSGIDEYTKKKMKVFPFWYLRQTLEKLTQAIGRTNRHKTDWSKTYIMDSGVDKVVYNMSEFMVNRIKSFKL